MSDPLISYYPVWAQNCRDSVAWLLDDETQTAFYAKHSSLEMPSREEREASAKDYAEKAEFYSRKAK